MPQSKQQKRLGALERRERDLKRRTVILEQLRPHELWPHELWRMTTYQRKADTAAADVRNLRKKLGIAEEDER